MTLEGKTALVVGFAGAIGSSIATSLANAGCNIIGVDKARQDSVMISINKIKEKQVDIPPPLKSAINLLDFFTLFDKH